MAHVEPMDVDAISNDFDDKENSLQNSNVPKTPSTEKGYEELDVSELNMKLRYSMTPASSPMSRSFTANCRDNKLCDNGNSTNMMNDTANLTRSFNSTITKANNSSKSPKIPLQALTTEQFLDGNGNPINRSLDAECNNVTITFSGTDNADDSLSLPSNSSSLVHTPEATTPTKEIPKAGDSPILRGLKSVLNMFRPSQSPIPPEDTSAINLSSSQKKEDSSNQNIFSTPTMVNKNKDNVSKNNSALKESVVFKDDLEKELLWKDETTIIFKEEKIPIHKLLLQPNFAVLEKIKTKPFEKENMNNTVEYMDVSYSDPVENKCVIESEHVLVQDKSERRNSPESDCEFLDCETHPKNDTKVLENNDQILIEIKESSTLSTEESAFQPNTLSENSILSTACNLVKEIHIPNIDDVLNEPETDLNYEQTNLSFVAENLDHTVSTTTKEVTSEDISKNLEDISTMENENIDNLNCVNETFDLDKNSENLVLSTDTKDKNCTNDATCITKSTSIFEGDSNSLDTIQTLQTINNTEQSDGYLLTNNINFTVTINKSTNQFENNMDTSEENNIPLPSESQEVNEVHDVIQPDPLVMPVNKCAEVVDIESEIKSYPEMIVTTIENNTKEYLDCKENMSVLKKENIHTDLPAHVPLPYDSDIDKDNFDDPCLVDINDVDLEAHRIKETSLNIPQRKLDSDGSCSQENKLCNVTPVENILPPENAIMVTDNTLIRHTLGVDVSEDMNVSNTCVINETVLCKENNELKNQIDFNKGDVTIPLNNFVDDLKCFVEDIENTLQSNVSPEMESYNSDIKLKTHGNSEIVCSNTNIVNEVTSEISGKENDEINTAPTYAMSVTEIEIDTCSHELKEEENPFETKNKLTTSLNLVMEVKSTESLLEDNHNNEITNEIDFGVKDEMSISSNIINISVTEMEVDVLNHDLEMCGKPLESENILRRSLEIPYVPGTTEHNNEIINKIEFETNDQLNTTTAKYNTFVTETDVSKHNENVLDLDAKSLEAQLSDTVIKESIKEKSVETTYIADEIETTSNINNVVLPPTNDYDPSTERSNELASKNVTKNLENQFEINDTGRVSPPISLKFPNKGYNINFDEIDDPFATKTNIRMSPTPTITEENIFNDKPIQKKTEIQKKVQTNRRKSYQERKKPNLRKKELGNVSFDCVSHSNEINLFQENTKTPEDNLKDKKINDISKEKENTANEQMENVDEEIEAINKLPQSISATRSRNVFNLPEIEDINFNPFATKTKIRQSPVKDTENTLIHEPNKSDYQNISSDTCPNRPHETIVHNHKTSEIEENNAKVSVKNLSPNLSTITCSTHDCNDLTVREVHTEDEDTEEGPFLEAEDFADFDKVAGTETDNMMDFNHLPDQSNNDNVENAEMFIDAEAFEFLLNQNKCNMVADSGKESLFLKFDPLFAKRISSDGVVAALNKIKNRQSTPKKQTLLKQTDYGDSLSTEPLTAAASTAPATTAVVEEPVPATSKPMMVVNPAVASIVSTRKSTTPPRANRRSLNFTSPAMAVIDRLLSLSGSSSRLEETSSVPPNREYNETDFALTQLREVLAEKEIHVHNLRLESKELKDRLANMESQVRTLQSESEERIRKVNELNERLTEKNKINKSLAVVVEEYERTIASLIAEMEQEKKRNAVERKRIISERDEQTAHLASMEVSFTDLHSKYEKSKQIILNMKSNEDTYRKSLKKFEDNLLKMQNNYELLKQHATSKLNHANQELEKYNRAHEAEVLKLNAMIKRKELHITSLEESLSQKTKANEELTAICDELINKVG